MNIIRYTKKWLAAKSLLTIFYHYEKHYLLEKEAQ